ncbi:MAG: SRPBCC domain-containing protein, partial [Acidobacteriota bacterium]
MFEILLLSSLLGTVLAPGTAKEKMIAKQVLVDGSLEAVWEAWTTSKGLETFFGRQCRIEPRPEGALEIWFDPQAPPGQRGAEGLMVLAVEPRNMLSFTWSAPPKWPHARRQRTSVVVRFKQVGDNQTRVRLFHSGWGEGEQWQHSFDYFTQA